MTLSSNMFSSTSEFKFHSDEWEKVGSSSKSSSKQQLKTAPFIKFKKSEKRMIIAEKSEPTFSKHSPRIPVGTSSIDFGQNSIKSCGISNCNDTIPRGKQNVLQTVVLSIQGNLNGDCAAMLCNVLEYQIECVHRISINLVTAIVTIRCYERIKEADLDRIAQILEKFGVKVLIVPDDVPNAAAVVAILSPNQVGPIQRPTRRFSLVEPMSQVNNSIQRPKRLSYKERNISI